MNNEKILNLLAGDSGDLKNQIIYKGVIDSSYSGSGDPPVKFDGQMAASGKLYKHLSNYTPTAGDTVLLVKYFGSYFILGKLV